MTPEDIFRSCMTNMQVYNEQRVFDLLNKGIKMNAQEYKERTAMDKLLGANSVQVGGNHYNMDGEQHWDRQWKLHGRGYFVGCITKYVERYDKKNGLQDLEKARHFLEKLIELEKELLAQKKLASDLAAMDLMKNGAVQSMPISEQVKVIIRNNGNPYANITDKDD